MDASDTLLGTPAAAVFKKTVRDVGWVFLVKISGISAGFLTYVMLTRLLEPDDLGRYFIYVSIAGFVGLIVQAGLATTTLKLMAEAFAKNDHAGALHVFRLTFGFMVLIAVFVAAIWLVGVGGQLLGRLAGPQIGGLVVYLLAIWFLLLALQKLMAEAFRASQNMMLASLVEGALASLVIAMVLTGFVVASISIELEDLLGLSVVVTLAVVLLAGAIILGRMRRFGHKGHVKKTMIAALAGPILLAEIAVFFNNQADIWIIAAFLRPEDIAQYGILLKVVLVVSLPGVIVGAVIAPKIIQTNQRGNKDEIEKLLGVSAAAAALPAVLMAVFLAVFGHGFLELSFGSTYAAAYPALMILVAARVVNALTGFCGPCLMLCGYQKTMMITTIMFAISAIVPAALVADTYGLTAVAACFATAMSLQNIVQMILVKRKMGISCLANFPMLLARFDGTQAKQGLL